MKSIATLACLSTAATALAACVLNVDVAYIAGGSGGATSSSSSDSSASTSTSTTGGTTSSSTGGEVCMSNSLGNDASQPSGCEAATGDVKYDAGAFPTDFCFTHHASEPEPLGEAAAGSVAMATACSEWYQQGYGPFVYKTIGDGSDFAMMAEATFDGPPVKAAHGGGILVRLPPAGLAGQAENFVLISEVPGGMSKPDIKVWSNVDGLAMPTIPAGSPTGSWTSQKLGMCRISGAILTGYNLGAGWVVAPPDDNPMYAGAVQIGVVAHAFESGPTPADMTELVHAHFARFRIHRSAGTNCATALQALDENLP